MPVGERLAYAFGVDGTVKTNLTHRKGLNIAEIVYAVVGSSTEGGIFDGKNLEALFGVLERIAIHNPDADFADGIASIDAIVLSPEGAEMVFKYGDKAEPFFNKLGTLFSGQNVDEHIGMESGPKQKKLRMEISKLLLRPENQELFRSNTEDLLWKNYSNLDEIELKAEDLQKIYFEAILKVFSPNFEMDKDEFEKFSQATAFVSNHAITPGSREATANDPKVINNALYFNDLVDRMTDAEGEYGIGILSQLRRVTDPVTGELLFPDNGELDANTIALIVASNATTGAGTHKALLNIGKRPGDFDTLGLSDYIMGLNDEQRKISLDRLIVFSVAEIAPAHVTFRKLTRDLKLADNKTLRQDSIIMVPYGAVAKHPRVKGALDEYISNFNNLLIENPPYPGLAFGKPEGNLTDADIERFCTGMGVAKKIGSSTLDFFLRQFSSFEAKNKNPKKDTFARRTTSLAEATIIMRK